MVWNDRSPDKCQVADCLEPIASRDASVCSAHRRPCIEEIFSFVKDPRHQLEQIDLGRRIASAPAQTLDARPSQSVQPAPRVIASAEPEAIPKVENAGTAAQDDNPHGRGDGEERDRLPIISEDVLIFCIKLIAMFFFLQWNSELMMASYGRLLLNSIDM